VLQSGWHTVFCEFARFVRTDPALGSGRMVMATAELGARGRSGAALKYYAFHKMQQSPWVWVCVQASPPMVAAYAAALFISRGKCSLGMSLSMATALLSVVLHLWLRIRGRMQAAAHVTCAGLLTFEIIWLCELLLMEADDLHRWSWNIQDSAAIVALGFFAMGTWIGSQRGLGHLSREVYAGTIVSWLCLEGAVRTVTFLRTADDHGPRVLFCIAAGSLMLGARATDSQGLISNAPTEWVVIQSTLLGVMFYLVVAPWVVQWELRTGVFLLSGLM